MGINFETCCDPFNIFSSVCIMLHNFSHAHAMTKFYILFEPVHEISNKLVCATSKASDQPVHKHSLIRGFASCLNIL